MMRRTPLYLAHVSDVDPSAVEVLNTHEIAYGFFEVASVTLAVWITSAIVIDAESNWLEGAFLLLVYGVLGVAFFYF